MMEATKTLLVFVKGVDFGCNSHSHTGSFMWFQSDNHICFLACTVHETPGPEIASRFLRLFICVSALITCQQLHHIVAMIDALETSQLRS